MIPGTTRRASRSSSYTAPAVTAVSRPRSSTVAPTTTVPSSRRGTRYTDEPCPRCPRTDADRGAVSRALGPAQPQDLPLHRPDRGAPHPAGRPRRPAPDQHPAATTTSRQARRAGEPSSEPNSPRHATRRRASTAVHAAPGGTSTPRVEAAAAEERLHQPAGVHLVVAPGQRAAPRSRRATPGSSRRGAPSRRCTRSTTEARACARWNFEELLRPTPDPRRRPRPRAFPEVAVPMPRPTAAVPAPSASNAGHRHADARASARGIDSHSPWCTSLTGGEHARCRPRGPPTGFGVDHGDSQAPGGDLPGRGEADDPSSDDDDVIVPVGPTVLVGCRSRPVPGVSPASCAQVAGTHGGILKGAAAGPVSSRASAKRPDLTRVTDHGETSVTTAKHPAFSGHLTPHPARPYYARPSSTTPAVSALVADLPRPAGAGSSFVRRSRLWSTWPTGAPPDAEVATSAAAGILKCRCPHRFLSQRAMATAIFPTPAASRRAWSSNPSTRTTPPGAGRPHRESWLSKRGSRSSAWRRGPGRSPTVVGCSAAPGPCPGMSAGRGGPLRNRHGTGHGTGQRPHGRPHWCSTASPSCFRKRVDTGGTASTSPRFGRGPSSTRACSPGWLRGVLPRPAPAPRSRVAWRSCTRASRRTPSPVLVPRPSVPGPGPQRRDQHGAGKPQLDARPRGAAQERPDPRGPSAALPHPAIPTGERLGHLRRGASSSTAPRGTEPSPRRAHDDPRGMGEPQRPWTRRAGPSTAYHAYAHGALGRSGRRGLHRRDGGGRGARPQRPASGALLGHRRRPGGAGVARLGVLDIDPAPGGAQGPAPARDACSWSTRPRVGSWTTTRSRPSSPSVHPYGQWLEEGQVQRWGTCRPG